MRIVKVNFEFPNHKAAVHVGNEYFLAGGQLRGKSINNLRKLNQFGEAKNLMEMPEAKEQFGLAYSESEDSLFTVGGFVHQTKSRLDGVTCYSVALDKW